MRKSVVRQNDFNQLCDRAGLSHAEAAALLSVSERTIARYANGTGHPSALGRRVLEQVARNVVQPPRHVSFRFIDLFAGIGGLRIGFQGIGGHCVFTSEWDANAQKTYAQNFRDNHPLAGDIREYAEVPAKIPEHDVLLAGFPVSHSRSPVSQRRTRWGGLTGSCATRKARCSSTRPRSSRTIVPSRLCLKT